MIKKSYLISFLVVTLIFTSCWHTNDDDTIELNQSAYDAVILQREAFENTTELMPPQPLDLSGKIYVKDQFLLINEPNKGFHIYDNSNSSNPVKIKFLKVLGSSDISIKDQILYINNAVDLIAVTFNSDFSSILVTKRVQNVFPILLSPDGFFANTTSESEIVVDWILTN